MVKLSDLGVIGCFLIVSDLGPIYTLNPSNPSEGSRRISRILQIRRFEGMLSVTRPISPSKRSRRRFFDGEGGENCVILPLKVKMLSQQYPGQ
jgi:hypothetical protein